MRETRKLAAILVADVVGYSRLAAADEDRTLARLRGLRSDLIDPAVAAHHGRIVKRTGDGLIAEFRSVVDAVRCAIEVQIAMVERNAGVAADKRVEFRVGIHLGDVVEEADGDLMGDGVNIAARLEAIAAAWRDLFIGGRLPPSERAARTRGHGSRPYATQEHCRPDRSLFTAGRRSCASEGRDASCPFSAKKAFELGGARLGDHGIDHCDDRRSVVPGRERADHCLDKSANDGRIERSGPTGRGRAPLHRRIAVRQPLKRPEPGLLRRWNYGELDH